MKMTLLLLAILSLVSAFHFNYKATSRHLKFRHHLKLRLTGKVSLRYLNLHGLYKYNKLGSQYEINANNANDFYQTCIGDLKDNEKAKALAKFEEIASKTAKTIANKMRSDFSQNYWVYYVGNEGDCKADSSKMGLQFMVMPAGDPREYDWSAPQNRLGFIKVCLNGSKTPKGGASPQDKGNESKLPYILMNCAFDDCETAHWQDA